VVKNFNFKTFLMGFMVTIFVIPSFSYFSVDSELKPHTAGPNCWDAAMYAVGATKSLRFMHPHEFLYLLDRYCTQTETPQYGDLGRMYDDNEVHAFIWLSESEVYAKHSNDSYEKYKIMPIKKILSDYGIKRECALDAVKENSCYRKTAYYSCHPKMDQTQVEMQLLAPIENLIFELVFSANTKFEFKKDCTSEAFQLRNEILNQINKEINNLKNIQHFDLEYLGKWALSMKNQVYESQVSAGYFHCKGVTYKEKYKNYRTTIDNLKELIEFGN
jgi:hypothetical protein